MKSDHAIICMDCNELFEAGTTQGNSCPKCASSATHQILDWLNTPGNTYIYVERLDRPTSED